MDSDFDNVLDSLNGTIQNFGISSFISKDTTCFGECPLNKNVQDIEVKFDIITS